MSKLDEALYNLWPDEAKAAKIQIKSLIKELIHSAPSLSVEQEDELTKMVEEL